MVGVNIVFQLIYDFFGKTCNISRTHLKVICILMFMYKKDIYINTINRAMSLCAYHTQMSKEGMRR